MNKTKSLVLLMICTFFIPIKTVFSYQNFAPFMGSIYENGKFKNHDIHHEASLSTIWQIAKSSFTTKRIAPTPKADIPVMAMDREMLDRDSNDAIFRLGHSSLLIRLEAQYILIDPIFSERASPVQWAGPKRFHQTPIAIEQLPAISAVVISHDHYDHLDENSIKALAGKVEYFITPLSIGKYLLDWGVPKKKIIELDWWHNFKLGALNIVATPSQHFSGRGLFDKDETLWASWVIQSDKRNLFYSGDGGYFSGFKTIGEKFGPFDFTMIETGAYNRLWADIHMTPEQSLQAHLDLNGEYMIPVHNGTFDLAFHDWYEPFERISALANKAGVSLLIPQFGEKIALNLPEKTLPWWQPLMPELTTSVINESTLSQ